MEADNGLEALSTLRRDGVDVALVDMMLPELDGFSLVRRIREQSALTIILIAARGEEANRSGPRAWSRRLRGQALLDARGRG